MRFVDRDSILCMSWYVMAVVYWSFARSVPCLKFPKMARCLATMTWHFSREHRSLSRCGDVTTKDNGITSCQSPKKALYLSQQLLLKGSLCRFFRWLN